LISLPLLDSHLIRASSGIGGRRGAGGIRRRRHRFPPSRRRSQSPRPRQPLLQDVLPLRETYHRTSQRPPSCRTLLPTRVPSSLPGISRSEISRRWRLAPVQLTLSRVNTPLFPSFPPHEANRRMSHSWDQTKTIGIPQKLPPTESQQERNNSLMRRLSLSGSAQRPPALSLARSMETQSALSQPPPPVEEKYTPTPPRRAATISAGSGVRRPPSPMGERMLKGDFHSF